DNRPVVPDRHRKSWGSERTFADDLTDPAAIEAGVLAMADEVWAWCEKTRVSGRTVTVKIKYADFRQVTRSRTLAAMITSQETLRSVSIDLVRTVFPPAKGIRLLGVTLSSFENAERSGVVVFVDHDVGARAFVDVATRHVHGHIYQPSSLLP